MAAGPWRYIKAAFNARPIGMIVPPNWVGLAALGMLGLVNPGFWLVGAGLELAYLIGLGTSRRFQRAVDGKALLAEQAQSQQRLTQIVSELDPELRESYLQLAHRCQSILDQQQPASGEAAGAAEGRAGAGPDGGGPELELQRQGLARLAWIYLRLLRAKQAILQVLRESIDLERGQGEALDRRVTRLRGEAARAGGEDLRRSLEGQIGILQQRLDKRRETRDKLALIEAELARIEQQVELIRDQAVIASEPHSVSERIDQIAATLGGTQQWIQDQRQIIGPLDEMLSEPPPLPLARRSASEG